MPKSNFYTQAHLVVAAIRVIEYQGNTPPSIEAVCRMLSIAPDQGSFLCHKLQTMGIIEVIEGAYGTRLFVLDHLKIEEIPQNAQTDSLQAEVEKFQESRKELTQKIETLQAEQTKKKKDLHAELEKQLKKGLKRK